MRNNKYMQKVRKKALFCLWSTIHYIEYYLQWINITTEECNNVLKKLNNSSLYSWYYSRFTDLLLKIESAFNNLLSGGTFVDVFFEVVEIFLEFFEPIPESNWPDWLVVPKRFSPVFRRSNRRTVFLKSGTVVA